VSPAVVGEPGRSGEQVGAVCSFFLVCLDDSRLVRVLQTGYVAFYFVSCGVTVTFWTAILYRSAYSGA
jgi:hypothetical protein